MEKNGRGFIEGRIRAHQPGSLDMTQFDSGSSILWGSMQSLEAMGISLLHNASNDDRPLMEEGAYLLLEFQADFLDFFVSLHIEVAKHQSTDPYFNVALMDKGNGLKQDELYWLLHYMLRVMTHTIAPEFDGHDLKRIMEACDDPYADTVNWYI